MPKLIFEDSNPTKQLNVRLPGELAREVRVICAYDDVPVTRYVSGVLESALGDAVANNPDLRGMLGYMMSAMGNNLVETDSGDFVVRKASENSQA